METDSDGEMEEFSGMELPPLINSLKRILSEYPDGGQIIKELIQNAEDAGATEVKILYDDRSINQDTGNDKAYRKFFKGPALCLYNNAMFQANDWKGIRMIDMSMKESDPLKVGKFGLGFKSVFHLTDNPCILSGHKLLLIDPLQPNFSKVNAMMELRKLNEYKKRMDVDAFFKALDGTFGISREIITTGIYPGTLFWFPLRQIPSKLSSNVYGMQKVKILLRFVETEYKSLLIFLRSLSCISLSRRTVSGTQKNVVVEIKNTSAVQMERENLKRRINQMSSDSATAALHNTLEIVVQCTKYSKCMSESQISVCKWLVVNYIMGNNASKKFMELIQDKGLALSPYVSVGAPLPIDAEDGLFEGHVFCFLPLPREGATLTGLPVHVNGFFALNQSRHHVKWMTDEQTLNQITDKDIMWNRCMISEALPIAYHIWITKAIEIANRHNSSLEYVASVHNTIPIRADVKEKWKGLLEPLFNTLKETSFLFSQNQQKWVNKELALFTNPADVLLDHYRETVIKVLTKMTKHYIDIPKGQVETLHYFFDLKMEQMLTPKLLSQLLRENKIYKKMSSDEKMLLLQYLLKDGFCHYLHGLQLIPVASKKWINFNGDSTEKIYQCSPKQLTLFPGLEDRFLLRQSKFPDRLFTHFDRMCKEGIHQLQMFYEDDQSVTETLLKSVIEQQSQGSDEKSLTGPLTIHWLREVWQFIDKKGMVSICQRVHLLPVQESTNWINPQKTIIMKVSDMMILGEQDDKKLPYFVCECLESLSVTVVPSLPEWIPSRTLKYLPNKDSVILLLMHIANYLNPVEKNHAVERFNNTNVSCRIEFMEYLASADLSNFQCIAFLCKFQMFRGTDCPTNAPRMFAKDDGLRFTTIKDFPMRYPTPLLDGFGIEMKLLLKLGAKEIAFDDLVLLTLQDVQKNKYSVQETRDFMEYLVRNFDRIKTDRNNLESIISLGRMIPFMRCNQQWMKASDLFDPSDEILQNLFIDEPMFPTHEYSSRGLKVLSNFGLKSRKNISAQDLLTSARILEVWSKSKTKTKKVYKKAQGLMKILTLCPEFLEHDCDGKPFKTIISDIECIEFLTERTHDFPKWLPWFSSAHSLCKPSQAKDISIVNLIGSVMHVVKCESEEMCEAFCWKTNIFEDQLISQLEKVRECFQARYEADLLIYLRTLYEWLRQKGFNAAVWKNKPAMWIRERFCMPEVVILSKSQNDINLKPYFHFMSETFEDLSDLFLNLGCQREQTISVLLTTLKTIADKAFVGKSDLDLAVTIIEKLEKRNDELTSFQREHMPLPVYSKDNVCFKPLVECTFTEAPEDYQLEKDETEDEMDLFDNLNFVSKVITEDVAKSLGVKTLQKRNFMDTEELIFEECGQEEELTARLNRLIEEGYRDGLSVPKELLQNADDAGAQHLKFLYDERENLDARDGLLDKGMGTVQGPALWVYNDAKFTDEDFINIRKLNAGTKENNVKTIGKFGLGFCSVYNLTDVPSFISGSNLVIFDPHRSHLGDALPGNSPGLKIDLSLTGNRRLLRRNKDQFKPYVDVFGCDLFCKDPYYDGTLFRLPFRTTDDAQNSKIKSRPYTRNDVSELLKLFAANAGNLLLFTQNIQSIEFFHLPAATKCVADQKIIFSVTRDCLLWNGNSFGAVSESILSQVASNETKVSAIQKMRIQLNSHHSINERRDAMNQSPELKSSFWIVSWATGIGPSKAFASNLKNVLNLAAIAVPCEETSGFPQELSHIGNGFFKEGRIYCFLPLPEYTKQPWHMHGSFEVTSDRRQLRVDTEDDKCSVGNNWNELLMSDAAVYAFIKLLIYFTHLPQTDSYLYHRLWPLNPNSAIKPFTSSFFRYIVKENVTLFKGDISFHSFNEIIFLDSSVRNRKGIGNIAYDMLLAFPPRPNYIFVDMPANVIKALEVNNDKALGDQIQAKIVRVAEMLIVFLNNIESSYWNSRVKERNKLILFALNLDDEKVNKMLERTKCIPCENAENLKRPNELIHPFAVAGSLYKDTDGVFPTNVQGFRSKIILQRLVKLGMIKSFLPIDFLKERCKSVEILSAECCSCGLARVENILKYLDRKSIYSKYRHDDIRVLRDIYWLPVMAKPSDWLMSWKSDSSRDLKTFKGTTCRDHHEMILVLSSPKTLYWQSDQDYVASVACLVDHRVFSIVDGKVWEMLGIDSVSTQKHFSKVVDHLCVISEEYNDNTKHLFQCYSELYRKIIRNLSEGIKDLDGTLKQERVQYLKILKHKAVVLINEGKLVPPNAVAFNVPEDCYPYLCKLPASERLFEPFYNAIGVKHHFDVAHIVSAMQDNHGGKKKVSNKEVKFIIRLLQNLANAMKREQNPYEFYSDFHDSITGPDKQGNLYPTHELVIEDDTFKTAVNMKIMHKDFPLSLGEQLGMKSKRKQCLREISFGIPWGQKERLVTRLHGLLQDYPCDYGIMKELLQNSDDANARELHFIKDYRTHPASNSLGGGHLQGPALCVYNDSYFTEDDLKGIQNLGIGSKQTDPSKTGQYGLGFNAVYHLTDTPSFLTKGPGLGECGLLCMLDPLCKNIPVEESNPGLIFPVDKVKENFPDALLGYLENDGFFWSGKGTMFRFPLRKEESDISSGIITQEIMDSLLEDFVAEMLSILLFVKQVKKIIISNISSSKLMHEYTLHVSICEEDEVKRNKFFKKVKEVTEFNKENPSKRLNNENIEVIYTLNIEDTRGHNFKWLVIQQFGCPKDFVIPDVISEKLENRQLGQLPIGGIAVPYPDIQEFSHHESVSNNSEHIYNSDVKSSIQKSVEIDSCTLQEDFNDLLNSSCDCIRDHKMRSTDEKGKSGRLYTFLPLPVSTGFLVHINGHFSLDHSRRALWDEGYRKQWNEMLGSALIAPSWVSAIRYFQQYFAPKKLVKMHVRSWGVMNKMMECYHSLFPLMSDCDQPFSREIVKQFYYLIVQKQVELFPVVRKDGQQFSVSWVPLQSRNMFGAVFNDIHSHFQPNGSSSKYDIDLKQVLSLKEVLIHIGMALIESPMSIHETIQELNFSQVHTTTPSFVMYFLKSFDADQPGSCSIGKLNAKLVNTNFVSIDRLKCVLDYITRAKEFPSEAEGLPLLLTADCILHPLCINSGIYLSRYSSLLPAAKSVFVADEFLECLDHEQLFTNKILSRFGIHELQQMLQREELDEYNTRKSVLWNKKEDKNLITPAWIDTFFKFVVEISTMNLAKGKEGFRTNIAIFEDWSFLPSVYSNGQFKLIPLCSAYFLFQKREQDMYPGVNRIITKFALPVLDEGIFSSNLVKIQVNDILANTAKPYKLLMCLSHHKESIAQASLTNAEVESILTYFDSHLDEFKSHGTKQKLRKLPLYCTYDGRFVSLDSGNILVLKGRIAAAGLKEWATRTDKVLLKQINRLSNLYKFLELTILEVVEFYTRELVPTMESLPKQYWLQHIRQMRDVLKVSQNNYDKQQLIMRLKSLPFIDVGNKMKSPNELYWPHNEVFSHMKTETDFPPHELRRKEWEEFFQLLNMNFEVTDGMLLQFAREIEAVAREYVSNDTRQKSEVLLSCFMKKTWERNTYVLIKAIKFVCPYIADKKLTDVYEQPDSTTRLICFENSIHSKHVLLSWSSVDLLKEIPHEKDITALLGIRLNPSVESVILHCQNVCLSFLEKIQLGTASTDLVTEVMENFYRFFQSNIETNALSLRRLDHFPVVYLPLHQFLVPAKGVVTEMAIEKEIKPYLYRAPVFFGRYFDVFVKIGAKEALDIGHCMYVLQQLKAKVNDAQLLPEELNITKKALLNLFHVLKESSISTPGDGPLFLPTRQRVLVDSKRLTISDNPFFEQMLKNKVEIDFFIDLGSLEIKNKNPTAAFTKLPELLRPEILSHCVRFRVCLEQAQEIEDSERAFKLEEFLHSDEFIQGLLRLVKQTMSQKEILFEEDRHGLQIANHVRSTRVIAVVNLNKVIIYKGTEIPGTEFSSDWHIEQGNDASNQDRLTFYVSESTNLSTDLEWILSLSEGLTDLIRVCTSCQIKGYLFLLLLRHLDRRSEISVELDKQRIDPLDQQQTFANSVFPKPGTYVEEHFHPFLEQAVKPFRKEEYDFVVMELEDLSLTADVEEEIEPVYIYVKIKRDLSASNVQSDLRRVYLVDTGNLNSTWQNIPIYRLYRFVRKSEDKGTAVVLYDSEPATLIPFDETCRRIRGMLQEAWYLPDKDRRKIIKRLKLKWHPDRNLENQDYCSRIFNYISSVILLLERGQQVSSVVDERTGREAPDMSESQYHVMVMNVTRRGKKYVKAFRDNLDDYNRSHYSGIYAHTTSRQIPRPDINEARRWMLQAKKDLRTATTYLASNDVDGYNWICYSSHQSCEKALRAAHYTKDANNVPGRSHSLRTIVWGLGADLSSLVQEFESKFRDYNRMRYPNSESRPDIPSDLYSKEDADVAIEMTRRIIEKVEECFDM